MTPPTDKTNDRLAALAACPFCGSQVEIDTKQGFRAITTGLMEEAVAIYCTRCSAQMMHCYSDHPGTPREDLEADLVASWNRRTTLAADQPEAGEAVFPPTQCSECGYKSFHERPDGSVICLHCKTITTPPAAKDRADFSTALANVDPIEQMRMVCQVARENDSLISRKWVNAWADQWESERLAAFAQQPAAKDGALGLPPLPEPWGYVRNVDGELQVSVGPKQPANRAGGYATPWAAAYGGDMMRDYALAASAQQAVVSEEKYRHLLGLIDAAARDESGMAGVAFSSQVPMELLDGKSESQIAELLCEAALRGSEVA